MELGISGKIAMVAAGTKGIGLACARALAQEGCRLAVCSRSDENLARAREALPGLHTFTCDVSNADELEIWYAKVCNDLGTPSILVTNTGGPPAGPLSQMTDAQWAAGIDATLMNVVRMVRLAAPAMTAAKWGRIVHITSLVSKEPSDMLPISSTLRAGLMALTRLQSNELAQHGITVNGVLPGHTLTDRQLHLADIRAEKLGISAPEALQRQADEVPMKRLADPSEIAAAVAFLCSVPAAYITGTNLLVDGGLTKGLG